MKLLSFGEMLWDVYPEEKYIGGAPLNFAAHSAKHGEDVAMLSAVGNDELGRETIEQVKKWGISTAYISVIDHKETGRCMVELDSNFVPTYHLLEDVAYDTIPCENLPDAFDVLYFGTLALRSESNFSSLKKLIETNHFREIFVDVNIREPFYSKEVVAFAAENATMIKISEEELSCVARLLDLQEDFTYQGFAQKLAEVYPNLTCIIITLGEKGAYALRCKEKAEYFCESKPVEVVSTVGAGDSFSAAFLHQYMQGKEMNFCLQYASNVAGFVVSKPGAVPDYHCEDFA